MRDALASIATSVQAAKYVRTWVGTERGADGPRLTRAELRHGIEKMSEAAQHLSEALAITMVANRFEPRPSQEVMCAAEAGVT